MGDRQVEGQLGQLSEALSQTKKSFFKKKEEVGAFGPTVIECSPRMWKAMGSNPNNI